MSRIGNKTVSIPSGVEVTVNDKNVSVKGPKGTLDFTHANGVNVKVENQEIIVVYHSFSLFCSIFWSNSNAF